MKSLTKILTDGCTYNDQPTLCKGDIQAIIDLTSGWLDAYKEKVEQESGDPDVKEWFYMAINELKSFLVKDSIKEGKTE